MTASFAAGPAPSFRLDVDGAPVALVTGAAGGIGARVALGLAEFGADVTCVDVSVDGLKETVTAIEGVGRRAVAIEADVADADAMAAAVRRAQDELGPLRHAVNCAGVHDNAPAESMPRAQWQRLLDVNLTGVFTCCQAEGAAMLAHGGGSIVNIGSISATIANRGLSQVHYNAAKAGVLHLTTSLALEWADRGVRVNAVSPGYTATPMAKHPDVWPHVQAYTKDIPLGRMAETEELVGPVVFLLSGAASYVTGANLLVDGGAVAW
ncbi:SDR family oxidoreductase [Actinomycetospora corticicola]|uniref:NAD(P)-dependent dehydrogenase (Short-subunit alcohol dehydrogenase family) n=1 Tax=Actinomycetospora corticicola TaxID=663602 RepID=A0A7Y9DRD9_9PSEU|nr:NAD(P)-dependent dehydrogenase (short-subunit alcohol dehydrogenase family) [Actinomycetospora corticicola]